MATIDTVNQLDGTEPCACDGGCGWRGPASALLSADDAILTPGDPSPAGRCPECEALAYVVESTEGIDAFATLEAITAILDGKEWNSDTAPEIAQLLRDSGYKVRDLDDLEACDECGAMIDTSNESEISAEHRETCSLHPSASAKPAEPPTPLSLTAAIDAFGEAQFECGEWDRNESDERYEALHQRAVEARAAVENMLAVLLPKAD